MCNFVVAKYNAIALQYNKVTQKQFKHNKVMKTFETKNIILELTENEVKLLLRALNSESIRRRKQGHEILEKELDTMWCTLYDIYI